MEKKMELRMRREIKDILIHHVGTKASDLVTNNIDKEDLLEDILGVFTNEVRSIDEYCQDKVIEARRIKVDELEQIRAEENAELLTQLKYYKGKVVELKEHIQEDKTVNTLKHKVTKLDNKVKVLKKMLNTFVDEI